MPHTPAPLESGDAGAAAVIQVLIARTRERLCAACAQEPARAHPAALSVRVPGTELFVITPDATDLNVVGPAQTSVMDMDGRVVATAWDGQTIPSSDAAAHAAAHAAGSREQDADAGHVVASASGRLAHASTPAAALLAVTDPVGPPPITGTRTGSDTALPLGKISDPHHHRRSTQ
ncbi:class II aldolase/adducin family protein [Microbacterium sp. MAHUQ-60]|uniref:class II aldolase/adducin family protein n=1 Tax=unclassified Microbacterium TaxID=2609290 RepID=UPI0036209B86